LTLGERSGDWMRMRVFLFILFEFGGSRREEKKLMMNTEDDEEKYEGRVQKNKNNICWNWVGPTFPLRV